MAATFGNFTDSVNGQITAHDTPAVRSSYRAMDARKVLTRVEKRLKALKISASAASKRAGKPDAIRNLQRAVADRNRQGWTAETLAAMAVALGTTVAWLAEGTGPEDTADEHAPTVPVWGRAGAGGSIYNFHEASPIDRIPAPHGAGEHTAAVEIVGDSLGLLFNHWYAVYDDVRDPPTSDLIGKLCILETADGRVWIKRLKKGRGKRFTLESNYDAPIYDVEVKWAARVKNLVPR